VSAPHKIYQSEQKHACAYLRNYSYYNRIRRNTRGAKIGRNALERSSGCHQFGIKRSGPKQAIILARTHVPRPTKTSYQRSGAHACNKTTTESEFG